MKIGQTLDMLCDGNISICDIPTIRVVLKDGNYFTVDNRRLWAFREMERLGKCREIPVRVIRELRGDKLTTKNGGISVVVRGDPGGRWHLQTPCNTGIKEFMASIDAFFGVPNISPFLLGAVTIISFIYILRSK